MQSPTNPTFQGNFSAGPRLAVARLLLRMVVPVPLVLGCDPQLEIAPSSPLGPSRAPATSLKWADPGDPICAFPTEADTAKIDAAEVVLRVLVRSDGSPQAVQTLQEPGFGFGAAATRCAMGRRYTPGHDARGLPAAAWTPPLHLRFIR